MIFVFLSIYFAIGMGVATFLYLHNGDHWYGVDDTPAMDFASFFLFMLLWPGFVIYGFAWQIGTWMRVLRKYRTWNKGDPENVGLHQANPIQEDGTHW